jgi:hypothetical protein
MSDDIHERFDKLVREINRTGWLVAGLHQIDDDHWQASVRKKGHFVSGIAQGRDPVAALADAWVHRKNPDRDRMPVHDLMEKPRERSETRERVSRERVEPRSTRIRI